MDKKNILNKFEKEGTKTRIEIKGREEIPWPQRYNHVTPLHGPIVLFFLINMICSWTILWPQRYNHVTPLRGPIVLPVCNKKQQQQRQQQWQWQ